MIAKNTNGKNPYFNESGALKKPQNMSELKLKVHND